MYIRPNKCKFDMKTLHNRGFKIIFSHEIAGTRQPSVTYAGLYPPLRKGVVSMRVVVVKFPKALCGLMRKLFHMD